jgi:cytochrome b561
MPLRNTRENYGSVARWLHWATALLFVAAYIAIYYRHWFTAPRTPANALAGQIHFLVGLSALVFALLRLLWRRVSPVPEPLGGRPLARLAAHFGHYVLYAVMIAAPLSGYLGRGRPTSVFGLFTLPRFGDTWLFSTVVQGWWGLDFERFETIIDFIHKDLLGQWLVWLLILGHAAAALYHHRVLQDRTLSRMTTG